MAKAVKKKARRLKRTIRKTLGALFLVSAIVVAAIPVDGLRAANGDVSAYAESRRNDTPMHVTIGDAEHPSAIPYVTLDETPANETIYNRRYGNWAGTYQFVIQQSTALSDAEDLEEHTRIAIIVGFGSEIVGSRLEMPNTVDAYLELNHKWCAVSEDKSRFLYYKSGEDYVRDENGNIIVDIVEEPRLDENGNPVEEIVQVQVFNPDGSPKTEWVTVPVLDAEGKPVLNPDGTPQTKLEEQLVFQDVKRPIIDKVERPRMQAIYSPCYFDEFDVWSKQEYHIENNPGSCLYYYEDNDTTKTLIEANKGTNQRLKNIPVAYIANQHNDADGNLIDNVDSGVFTGALTCTTLVLSKYILGIGSYAFSGNVNIHDLEFKDYVREIGNNAFRDCSGIATIKIPSNSSMQVIGDHTFYNCRGLTSFDAPTAITAVGDSAFEGCAALTSINLCGVANTSSLNKIGHYAFAGCESLQSVVVPPTYAESIPISTFEGCTSLKYIHAQNSAVNLVDDTGYYTLVDFRNDLENMENEEFYIEGYKDSVLQSTAVENYFTFKYHEQETYIRKIPDETSNYNETTGKWDLNATFWVTRSSGEPGTPGDGQISRATIDSGLRNLRLPGHVGPLSVRQVGDSAFRNNCALTGVIVPSTVTSIGPNAFRGCHNLVSVIFEKAESIAYADIGTDAFNTQGFELSSHKDCPTGALTRTPALSFTGTIGSSVGPFQYAMDPNNKVNTGASQQNAWITYYSGWPTNLTVENVNGVATLTNYPTIQQLMKREFTADKYHYMTLDKDYERAAYYAFYKYLGVIDQANAASLTRADDYDMTRITGYEQDIIDHTLTVELPEGIEDIQDNLFGNREGAEFEHLLPYLDRNTVSSGDLTSSGTSKPLGKAFRIHLKRLDAESFKDCKTLESISIGAGIESIGDHAFQDCISLQEVWVDPSLTSMGIAPFIGCNKLGKDETNTVHFQNNPNFSCVDSVIYGKAADGTMARLIEYLNGRDYKTLTDAELAPVKEIAQEAFKNTSVETVDFGASGITEIFDECFANTERLISVTLPYGFRRIGNKAFLNSGIRYLHAPVTWEDTGDEAFSGVPNYLTVYSGEDCYAQRYSDNNPSHPNLKWAKEEGITFYTVQFFYNDEEGEKHLVYTAENVKTGESVDVDGLLKEGAFDEVPKEVNGLVFQKTWSPKSNYVNVGGDKLILEVYAVYGQAARHRVTFLDRENNIIWADDVLVGGNVYTPTPPAVEGMTFSGWESTSPGLPGQYSIKDLDTIEEDVIFRAVYVSNTNPTDPSNPTDPNNPTNPTNPTDPNNPTNPTNPTDPNNPTNPTNPTDPNNPTNPTNPTDPNNPTNPTGPTAGNYYTLTVRNGSGSGSYLEGAQAIIVADDPAPGMEFHNWTIEPANAPIASTGVSATVVTMPAVNVVVTANYRTKQGNSVTTGSGGTTSGNSSTRPGGSTGTVNKGGTTVVIDKNGLSNTGVVSATVNGSSDNFVIKITESSAASEAAVKALMAEYGDLTNIKYFPMDISLYDSTGTRKITDTQGLSISITLPLPDSLITYAGNNKVAGVVNDRLDKLTPKFTTISGVSCITFTAEHFSPYVIYVDTANLTAGSSDNTPKTGDGIHPKWFLSVGLACVSMVLFMKRDRKTVKKRQMA